MIQDLPQVVQVVGLVEGVEEAAVAAVGFVVPAEVVVVGEKTRVVVETTPGAGAYVGGKEDLNL